MQGSNSIFTISVFPPKLEPTTKGKNLLPLEQIPSKQVSFPFGGAMSSKKAKQDSQKLSSFEK